MLKKLCYLLLSLSQPAIILAQESEGNYISDKKTGCKVWFRHTFAEDSVTWSGGCENGLAEGKGTMTGFTEGQPTSTYKGSMHAGKPHGQGDFTFWGDRRLKGNFDNGEPLFLEKTLRDRLVKVNISSQDSTAQYLGDNNQQQLYYHALIPDGTLKGAVILMPGTWETTEHLLSSMSRFCSLAWKNKLAVIVPSINQRLTLTEYTLQLMNSMFDDAISRFHLPAEKMVMGGWSMGGLFSLRYTEMSRQDAKLTRISPAAVFSCDGPCDLANIYNAFRLKINKNPGQNEPAYGMREMEKYCGGTPESAPDKYVWYSAYSHNAPDGGNARFLKQTPVRIYNDVDPVWWMQNRHVDMYDLNALDQTAMIQMLNDMGNKDAEFINAFGRGYRLEGNRHPHSWSTVDPDDCMTWILKHLETGK